MSIATLSEAAPSFSMRTARHAAGQLAETTLDIIPVGIVLVDGACRILHRNAAAADMLAARTPILSYREQLHPACKVARQQLLAAVRRVAAGASNRSGDESVPLPYDDGRAAVAHVRPLDPARNSTPGAAIFITQPAPQAPVPLAALTALFGLTKSEVRVLAQIVDGRNRRETAAILALSDATVATHLRGIFLKTATSDQHQLCRKVAALSWPLRV